jgi:hypothetical protein
MNSDSDGVGEKSYYRQNTLKEVLSLRPSNAFVDGASHRGWFIGPFLAHTCELRSTSAIEVKWKAYHPGEERVLWGSSEQATTLCMLFKGKVQIIFPQQKCLLSQEGDYIIWPAGIPHRWKVFEDSCVLTIRWPALPEDHKGQGILRSL